MPPWVTNLTGLQNSPTLGIFLNISHWAKGTAWSSAALTSVQATPRVLSGVGSHRYPDSVKTVLLYAVSLGRTELHVFLFKCHLSPGLFPPLGQVSTFRGPLPQEGSVRADYVLGLPHNHDSKKWSCLLYVLEAVLSARCTRGKRQAPAKPRARRALSTYCPSPSSWP